MADLTESTEVLMDPDVWVSTAAVGGAYAGSAIVDSLITGMAPGPEEAAGVGAGLGVAAGGYSFATGFEEEAVTGGSLYALGSAAEYFGFKQTVMSIGSDMKMGGQ